MGGLEWVFKLTLLVLCSDSFDSLLPLNNVVLVQTAVSFRRALSLCCEDLVSYNSVYAVCLSFHREQFSFFK